MEDKEDKGDSRIYWDGKGDITDFGELDKR